MMCSSDFSHIREFSRFALEHHVHELAVTRSHLFGIHNLVTSRNLKHGLKEILSFAELTILHHVLSDFVVQSGDDTYINVCVRKKERKRF